MKPDEQDFVLSFIRGEHREWRRGVDDRLDAAEKRLESVEQRLDAIEGTQATEAIARQAVKDAQLEAEYRTQSGSWDGPAMRAMILVALQQHLQQQKKHSTAPPPAAARWIASALDTAVGKAVAVTTSILVGGLLQYLLSHWPH